jgi:hypothetical protein
MKTHSLCFRNLLFLLPGIILLSSCAEKKADTAFFTIPPADTGIEFNNALTQTNDFNIIEYLYFYNGGGVAAGDINNDGLIDLYFTANQSSNKLYINKGNFVFEDITEKAGAAGVGNWKTGVTMADVNGDGFLDLFVCGVGHYKKFDGRNQLLINNGDLTFTDKTDSYGLSFQGFSTQASFFDYDNDGDLDMYLLNHSVHTTRSYGHVRLRYESDRFAGDKLYRNDLYPHGVNRFTEVTSLAGIYNSQVAYGLGLGVSDFNKDGLMDIYVSNDFQENDYLYINQGNGRFAEELEQCVPHVSRFSMGNDVADVNNDGWTDIVTLDMLPMDEGIIKTTAGEEPYDIYEFKRGFGYHHQFSKNALQLSRGVDDQGHLFFSDIAQLAGVAASDWSWSPLLADFDNDGNKDLFIANGILTRPNDLDYINFISSDSAHRNYQYGAFIKNMPSGKVPNIFFRNRGNLTFADVSTKWIGQEPTLSTGAAYADLDNDGDLDLVLNNINDVASVLRNDITPGNDSGYLQIELKGSGANTLGIGAKISVYVKDKLFYQEQALTRGWLSSVTPILHIGLGKAEMIDSISIIWPDNKFQTLKSIRKNQRLKVHQSDAVKVWNYNQKRTYVRPSILSQQLNIPFRHRENKFNAFNNEKLIPHMASTEGPCIAVGDVDSDNRQDFFIGGASGQSGAIFTQGTVGKFRRSTQRWLSQDSLPEDTGAAFFDADGDGREDLIVISGGQQFVGNDSNLLPRLYLNSPSGEFTRSNGRLPEIFVNASCVKPADIDGDGDVDLFIGGRVVTKAYGVSPPSFFLVNDGSGHYSDETVRLLGGSDDRAHQLGMVTDAVWADMNHDERPDLVLVGEWAPVSIFLQDSDGKFQNRTRDFGLDKTNGWWNTLAVEDFDKDGDLDIIAGNMGTNSRLKPSLQEPVSLYFEDVDNNGGMDHVITYFNGGKSYPFISRDQLVKQIPGLKKKFLKYADFRNIRLEDIIPASDSGKCSALHAFEFQSMYFENNGPGEFLSKPLPTAAQMFPVFAFAVEDFNNDGDADILAVGNLYAAQPEFGRYDAGYGLMMIGDSKGNFKALTPQESGFLVRGEGRDIQVFQGVKDEMLVLVGMNNDSLRVYKKSSK